MSGLRQTNQYKRLSQTLVTPGRYGAPLLTSGAFQPSGPTSHQSGLIFFVHGMRTRSVMTTVSFTWPSLRTEVRSRWRREIRGPAGCADTQTKLIDEPVEGQSGRCPGASDAE